MNGYNCYKHLKNTKIKRGTGDKIKNNDKIDTTNKEIASQSLPTFSLSAGFQLTRVSLILHCNSDFPVVRISKCSHLML